MKKKILALLLVAGYAHAADPDAANTWVRIGHAPIWEKTVLHTDNPATLYLWVLDGQTHFAVGLPCKSTGIRQVFQWKPAEDVATTRKSCPDRPMAIKATDWSQHLNPLPPDYSPKERYIRLASE